MGAGPEGARHCGHPAALLPEGPPRRSLLPQHGESMGLFWFLGPGGDPVGPPEKSTPVQGQIAQPGWPAASSTCAFSVPIQTVHQWLSARAVWIASVRGTHGGGQGRCTTSRSPRLRAWFSPNGKRKCGLFPNVLGFRFWASAAFSAPRWGSWAQQVGQVAATSRVVISSAADKQVRDCELTSLAPGQGLSNARCYRHSPGQSAHYSLGKGCGDICPLPTRCQQQSPL